jgi:hypothetical protein
LSSAAGARHKMTAKTKKLGVNVVIIPNANA